MPAILRASVKTMCAEPHCSSDEQRVIASAIDKALPTAPAS